MESCFHKPEPPIKNNKKLANQAYLSNWSCFLLLIGCFTPQPRAAGNKAKYQEGSRWFPLSDYPLLNGYFYGRNRQ